METFKSHTDHGRVLGATFLWAGASLLMAVVVGLPLFDSRPERARR